MPDVVVMGAGASREYRGVMGRIFMDCDFFSTVQDMWDRSMHSGEPDVYSGIDRRSDFYDGSKSDWRTLRATIMAAAGSDVADLGLEQAFVAVCKNAPESVDQFIRCIELALFYKLRALTPETLPIHVALMRRVLKPGVSFLTFNYDPLIEAAIELVSDECGVRWSPFDGYGLTFDAEVTAPNDQLSTPDLHAHSDMQVLKLHGSMNWLVPRGNPPDSRRYLFRLVPGNLGGPGAIIHTDGDSALRPLFVPPSPSKDFASHGLSGLWQLAEAALARAGSLTVIGYSFPETDMDARRLFEQAAKTMSPSAPVTFVTKDDRTKDDRTAESWFTSIFPGAIVHRNGFAQWLRDTAPAHIVPEQQAR